MSNSEQANKMQSNFKFILMVLTFIVIQYILQYNYLFNVTFLNHILIPLTASSLLIGLFTLYTKNHYTKAATLYVIVYLLISAYFLLVTGGFDSPGALWITSYPIVGANVFGKKGSYLGFVMTIIVCICFYLLGDIELQARINFESAPLYKYETIIHLLTFLLTVTILVMKHFNDIEKSTRLLKDGHHKIDTLLRVVLHDMANPLFFLQNKMKKIRRLDKEKQDIELDKVDRALQEMSQQLTIVREMKAMQDGKLTSSLQQENILKLIQEVLLGLEEKLKQKNLTIKQEHESIN